MLAIRTAYAGRRGDVGLPLAPASVTAIAVVIAIMCRWPTGAAVWWAVAAIGVVCARRDPLPWRFLLVLAVAAVCAGWRSDAAHAALAPIEPRTVTGWVGLVNDPAPYAGATRVVIAVDDQRLESWIRGRAMQQRARRWRAGDRLHLHGDVRPLDGERQRRVAWEHVVGRLDIEWVSDGAAGSPVANASNRVRGLIGAASSHLPGSDGPLYRGLVIGDDRDQPPEMIQRFRASGLSHLTAVSGQNVAYVLAAAGPLLRRLRPATRWMLTVAVIAWFVALTRFEPSIVRAGVMAAISTTAFALGRDRTPARVLVLAVAVLLLVDPLLVYSVGFALSVGATAGVVVLGPRLAARLGSLGPLATPVGVTLGAQLGVAAPQLLVFGSLPVVSLPANLLAGPVAGMVMLYGLPAGLVSGMVPWLAPVAMFPCRLGVRWVDTVAAWAAWAEPGGPTTWYAWLAIAVAVVALARFRRPARPSI